MKEIILYEWNVNRESWEHVQQHLYRHWDQLHQPFTVTTSTGRPIRPIISYIIVFIPREVDPSCRNHALMTMTVLLSCCYAELRQAVSFIHRSRISVWGSIWFEDLCEKLKKEKFRFHVHLNTTLTCSQREFLLLVPALKTSPPSALCFKGHLFQLRLQQSESDSRVSLT